MMVMRMGPGKVRLKICLVEDKSAKDDEDVDDKDDDQAGDGKGESSRWSFFKYKTLKDIVVKAKGAASENVVAFIKE